MEDEKMRKRIIIINGSGGVGKDTFVEFCRPFANITNISSVDKIKEAAAILGWDQGKTERCRKFLSDLKILSTEFNDFPYDYVANRIAEFKKDNSSHTMFIHVREPQDIQRIKDDFGCVTLLVRNVNKGVITTNMADANVENYDYDFVVDNDGDLDDLKAKAIEFINSVD
jgi:hypothetical protein